MKRIARVLVAVVVLAVAGYFAWNYFANGGGAAAALGGSGTIETVQIALTPQISGRIIQAPAEEGVTVKQGEVLFRLDATLADLQVSQARAGVAAAQANYDQVWTASGSKSSDKAAAKAQLDQAKAALKMAQVQAGYAQIVSPIDGVLTNLAARAGENAVPGSTLAVVSDPTSMTVTIYIAESQIGLVKVGQSGTLTTDSTGTKAYHAQVVFVGSQAEFTPASIETKDQRVKLVYQVKLRITDADSALKPGMPADVVLQ
jgi:HlyD family secretion protein